MSTRSMTGLHLALWGSSLLTGFCPLQGFAETRGAGAPDPQAIDQVSSCQGTVANVAWWGFDAEDSTQFLQSAIDSGARKVIVPYRGAPWIITPVKLRSNLELVFEPGVVVLAKGGVYHGRHDSLFSAVDAHDVTVRGYGATLRMQKKDYQSEAYEKAEWRMVLNFHGCRRVRVEGLRLESSGGDGIYLGAGSLGYCADVVIRDVACHDNHRQGISVISAVNLLIENCVLSGTEGTSPQAGIDFEPNDPENKLVNCVLRNCVIENNTGAGILIYPKPLSKQSDPISIRVENCLLRGGKGAGIEIGAVLDDGPDGIIEFDNCTIERTALAGIAVHDKSAERARVRFVNCRCKDVGLRTDGAGFDKDERAAPLRVTSRRPKLVKKHGGIDFVNCYVYDTVDRPALVLGDQGSGSGVHDLTGSITVYNPHGARVDRRCKTSGLVVQVVEKGKEAQSND